MASLSAELEAGIYHALKAICGSLAPCDPPDDCLICRGNAALEAWERRRPIVPSGPTATVRECPPKLPIPMNAESVRGRDRDCVLMDQRCAKKEENNREANIREVEELYGHWIAVLARYEGGIFPSATRVRKQPGPRVIAALKKALREAPLDTCKRAIEGAYWHWQRRGIGGKGVTDVFATFRGTGDLPSRINWLAALSDTPDDDGRTTKLGLDAPGVRSRIEDVRREVRAALDLPTPPFIARAAQGERWLHSLGQKIVLDGRAFSITAIRPGEPVDFVFG